MTTKQIAEAAVREAISKFGFDISRSSKKEVPCRIYIIYDKYFRRFKIGRTRDLTTRVNAIANSSGSEMELVGSFEGWPSNEITLHAALKEFRLKGEWYRYDSRVLDMFKEWECGVLTGAGLGDWS